MGRLITKNFRPTRSVKQIKESMLLEMYDKLAHYEDMEELGRLIVTPETGIGDLSDGYHTFNELYHHRAVLFSVICNSFKSCAWKSKKHSDGTMYDGMFIVGIDTPEGSATYHYDIEPYWNMFDVKELDKAPEWDGHTPDDAINRIAGLSKSNRLIELPCAVGDTVYVVTACENVIMNHDNDYFYGTGAIECPYEEDCPHEDCGDDNKRVFETCCSNIYLDEDGFNIILEDFAFTATLEDFGKTVFLTKEEAEAKLEELKGE